MFSAPLSCSLVENATDEAMTIAAIDINTTLSNTLINSSPFGLWISRSIFHYRYTLLLSEQLFLTA
jgi:hypothetical protein